MALKDVLLDELRDMYSAENQLVKALPKLARGAKNKEMKDLFKTHLEETKGQVLRLREVFGHLGKKPTGQHCNGMQGVIEEGTEALEKDEEGPSFDAGLFGAALRTEHYEIAGYHTCIAIAKSLGERDIVALLKQNLDEEIAAAKKLTTAAQPILKEAAKEPEEEEDEDSKPKSAKEKESERKSKDDERKAAGDVKAKRGPGTKAASQSNAGSGDDESEDAEEPEE